MDFVQGLHQAFEKCVASVGECFFDFNNADGTSSPSKANEAWASIKLKLHSFIQHGNDVIKNYLKNSQNITPSKPLSERKPEGEEREICPLDKVLPGENFQGEGNDLSLEQTLPATNSENESNVSFLEKSLTTLCRLIKNKDTEETVIDIMANILNEAQPKGNSEPKGLTREQVENVKNSIAILCTFIDDESGQAEAEKIKTELFSFIEKERETDLTSAIYETSPEFDDSSLEGKLDELGKLIGRAENTSSDLTTIPCITISRLKDALLNFEQLSPQEREMAIERLKPILEALSLFVKNLPTDVSRINEILGSIALDLGVQLDIASIEKQANDEKKALKQAFLIENIDNSETPRVGFLYYFDLKGKLDSLSSLLINGNSKGCESVTNIAETLNYNFLNLENLQSDEQIGKIKELRTTLANVLSLKDELNNFDEVLDVVKNIVNGVFTEMRLAPKVRDFLDINLFYDDETLNKWQSKYSLDLSKQQAKAGQQISKETPNFLSQKEFIEQEINGIIIPNRGAGDCFLRSIVQNLLPSSIFIAREEEDTFVEMTRTGLSRFATKINSERSKIADEKKQNLQETLLKIEYKTDSSSPESQNVEEKRNEIQQRISNLKLRIKQCETEIKDAESLEKEIERISRMGEEIESDSVLIRFLSILIKRPIVVFSEFTNNPGYVTYISPDGNSVSLSFNDLRKNPSALRQAIFVYHTGNNKGGHYELAYMLNNIGQ